MPVRLKSFIRESGIFLFEPKIKPAAKEEAGSISIKMEYHSNLESLSIPVNEIPDRIHEIPKEKPIGIFCPANVRSAIVYAYLLSKGYADVRIVEGGYSALTEALKPGKVLKAL